MLNLEELALYVIIGSITTFNDGNNLKKNIVNHLPRLKNFVFNIRSILYLDNEPHLLLPSNEEIQQTFINFTNNKVITCVDYFPRIGIGECHMYSYPYTMIHYRNITNNFPGGLFKYVREVSLFDERPFEYEFFIRIAQSFPFLQILYLENKKPQEHKQCRILNDDNQDFSTIKYSHLIKLSLIHAHSDYIEQFLDHTKTSISNNISLSVNYYSLRKATNNFKRNDLRANCSKLSHLRIHGKIQISKHFKTYFPNVKEIQYLPKY